MRYAVYHKDTPFQERGFSRRKDALAYAIKNNLTAWDYDNEYYVYDPDFKPSKKFLEVIDMINSLTAERIKAGKNVRNR